MKEIDAEKDFGVCDILVYPLNDDNSQPSPTNIVGGVGPFDFSGAADPAAVEFKSKIDGGAVETDTLDFVTPPVADINNVTVDEVVAAITAAAPTDLTASKDGTTGRLKIAYSGAGSPIRVQVWGEGPETALIGQGKGMRIAYMDTQQSITDSPTNKDDETFTITTSKGKDTDVKASGYRKGVSGVITDTAGDYLFRSIIEGGTYDETNEEYEAPTSEQEKIVFAIEAYSPRYQSGANDEVNIYKYLKTIVYNCTGTFGDRTKERGFTTWIYNYSATSWRDSNGDLKGDSKETKLTPSEYEALNLGDLAA